MTPRPTTPRLRGLGLAACLTLAATLGASGCYRTTLHLNDPGRQVDNIRWEKGWYHGVVLGLADLSGPLAVDELCPEGIVRLHRRISFLNGLARGFTLNIYTPQQVTVTCARP
jgi:hypothetical protein